MNQAFLSSIELILSLIVIIANTCCYCSSLLDSCELSVQYFPPPSPSAIHPRSPVRSLASDLRAPSADSVCSRAPKRCVELPADAAQVRPDVHADRREQTENHARLRPPTSCRTSAR